MARTKGKPLAASAASVAGPPAQPLTPDRLDAATVAASMRCHRIRAAMGNWSAGCTTVGVKGRQGKTAGMAHHWNSATSAQGRRSPPHNAVPRHHACRAAAAGALTRHGCPSRNPQPQSAVSHTRIPLALTTRRPTHTPWRPSHSPPPRSRPTPFHPPPGAAGCGPQTGSGRRSR